MTREEAVNILSTTFDGPQYDYACMDVEKDRLFDRMSLVKPNDGDWVISYYMDEYGPTYNVTLKHDENPNECCSDEQIALLSYCGLIDANGWIDHR